jgi:hypothetical protein
MPLVILLVALIMGAAIVASTAIFSTALVICVTVVALSLLGATALACRAANRIAAWHYGQLDQAVSRRLGAYAPLPRASLPRDVCARCGHEVAATLHREGVPR